MSKRDAQSRSTDSVGVHPTGSTPRRHRGLAGKSKCRVLLGKREGSSLGGGWSGRDRWLRGDEIPPARHQGTETASGQHHTDLSPRFFAKHKVKLTPGQNPENGVVCLKKKQKPFSVLSFANTFTRPVYIYPIWLFYACRGWEPYTVRQQMKMFR